MVSAVISAGVSLLTALGVPQITAVTLGILYGQTAASILISVALRALTSKGTPSQSDIGKELSTPTALPAYRFVYGYTRATGSLIFHAIKEDYLYTCHLLNSRESEGEFKLYLDERLVEVSGDPYNLISSGGSATTDIFTDHLQVWFGKGDQTQVPSELLSDIPWSESNTDYLKTTDIGKGMTVVWLKMKAGESGDRNERWPSAPPSVTVEGKFSKVYDPRNPSHSFSNKDTWAYSNNQALCTMDLLTQNPFQPYPISFLEVGQFEDAADYADEVMTRKDLTTEPRYTVNGTIAFTGSELEDIANPLYLAGASSPTNTAGKLGINTSQSHASSYTVTDILEGFSYSNIKSKEDMPNLLEVTYTRGDLEFIENSLAPYSIAKDNDLGVERVASIDLTLVTSYSQAMRVRKILGKKYNEEEELQCVVPPNAFDLIAGATATLDLPAPFNRFNKDYTVVSCHPCMDLVGEDGVALRNTLALVSLAQNLDSWNPAVDEEDVYTEEYNSSRSGVRPPTNISVSTGDEVDRYNGGSVTPRFRVAFDPSPSQGITSYSWRYRAGDEGWVNGAAISPLNVDDTGQVFTFIENIDPTIPYDIEVKAVASSGTSTALTILDVTRVFEVTAVTATGGVGEVVFAMTTPTTNFKGINTYRNSVGGGLGTAIQIGSTVLYDGGSSITHTVTSQPVGSYDYWVTPVYLTGQLGSANGPHTVTIT